MGWNVSNVASSSEILWHLECSVVEQTLGWHPSLATDFDRKQVTKPLALCSSSIHKNEGLEPGVCSSAAQSLSGVREVTSSIPDTKKGRGLSCIFSDVPSSSANV